MGHKATYGLFAWMLVGCCWALTAKAQFTPSTRPVPTEVSSDSVQVRKFQVRKLQARIDQQATEIERLKAAVAALSRQLENAGLIPVLPGAAIQPAKPPQKLLFLIHCGDELIYGHERAYGEVLKAIGELQPPQSFSIFFPPARGLSPCSGAVSPRPLPRTGAGPRRSSRANCWTMPTWARG